MAEAVNNWSLFGLDLTRSGKWLSLGLRQLLYDRDAWLLRRFDPVIRVMQGEKATLYQADHALEARRQQERFAQAEAVFSAVALPSDAVLLKTLSLPRSAEEDLEAAMLLEVGLSSPFAEADTRAAWRVTDRRDDVIVVTLAITAQAAIDAVLPSANSENAPSGGYSPEVWALSDAGVPIPFEGFGGHARKRAYQRAIGHWALMLGAAWLAVMVALSVVAGATAWRADDLDATFQQVRRDAAQAATQRERLAEGRSRLSAIEAAVSERPNYQYWLNHIAASAPNTVYLDVLNFDGKQVTVSGYSDNAAVYLRLLTEQPEYTDVTALSAFSRDRNNGLERFSIQWSVTEPAMPVMSSESDATAGVTEGKTAQAEAGL